jgi:flagellar basal body-associated protein FliL
MTTTTPNQSTQTTSPAPKTKTSSAPTKKPVSKPSVKKTAPPTKTETETTKPADFPVQNQIAPFSVKKKKGDKARVIRDSFSFPRQDHHKITELKKICLAAGVHVKKGEILRAGLNLLTNLSLAELLVAVENVDRIKTGRPKTSKK